MGTFLFKWEHPASEVFVTGTFDDWQKTEKLAKTDNGFEKEVTLPSAADKIYYKFVVDGNWVTDHTAPQENDHSGNLNNVLTPDRITPATAGIMSGVTPSSTTAQMVKNVPKDNGNGAVSHLPGAFPETPVTEPEAFSVNPIPASEGAGNPVKLAAGEPVPHPSQFTSNTISSTVHDDEELKAADAAKGQTFGVSPIPATAGAGNPIKLAAGEPVPPASQITGNTVYSTVRTDKASYENSGGIGNVPVLPPVVTPQVERDAKGTGILDMPSSRNIIPESSLPMGGDGAGTYDAGPTIQSAGPTSTTAGLAANVPLEKDSKKKSKKKKGKKSTAPEIVQESQSKADFPPEASASAEEVKEKADVEKELLAETPLAPVTSDGSTTKAAKSSTTGAAAAIGGAAVAVGGAAAAAAVTAKDKLSESVSHAPNVADITQSLPESVQKSISSMNETAKRQSVAGGEASAAPSAALAAPAEAPAAEPAVTREVSADAPAVVRQSISMAHESPEAAAYAVPIEEKQEVEMELLDKVPRDLSKGEPAPKAKPVAAEPEKEVELPQEAQVVPPPHAARSDSRDVSPTTVLGEHAQTAPVVTTGVEAVAAPRTSVSAVPAPVEEEEKPVVAPGLAEEGRQEERASTGENGTAAKAKKRRSFFGKLKDKLKEL